jgi:hypothetical protein
MTGKPAARRVRFTIRAGWEEKLDPLPGQTVYACRARRMEEIKNGIGEHVPANGQMDIDMRGVE